jgi:hypothetical protein
VYTAKVLKQHTQNIMSVIFVHIPKTAGTALSNEIGTRVGNNISYEGYEKTIRTPTWHQRMLFRLIQSKFAHTQRPTIIARYQYLWRMLYAPRHKQYIFGHFYVQKYLQPAPHMRWEKYPHYKYVSFVREPLSRAISKYYYTLQVAKSTDADPISLNFAKTFPSLNDFLMCDQYSNIQSRYIGALPLSEYACIGVVEELDKSLFVLGHAIPEFASLSLRSVNQTAFKDEQEVQAIPSSILSIFHAQNYRDYSLYTAALTHLQRTYQYLLHSEKISK